MKLESRDVSYLCSRVTIIEDLAEKLNMEFRLAVEINYISRLAIQISTGEYGI